MKLFLLVAAVFPATYAITCNQYASIIEGDPKEHYFYNQSLAQLGKLDTVFVQKCAEREVCVGDAYLFKNKDGSKAGFIWMSCFPKGGPADHCFWQNNKLGEQYRCICTADNCQTKEHLRAQWDEAFKAVRNTQPGPKNRYAIFPRP